MILQPGEQGIASQPVKSVVGADVRSGQLYLTNARLVFEGMFKEERVGWVPRTLLDLHLGLITNAVAVPGRGNRHTLRIEAGRGYVYTFLTASAPEWVASIVQAKARVPPTAYAPPPPPGGAGPVVVNVHSAPTAPTVYLHCTHCGTLAPGGSVRCPSCGAAL
ncbi:MAG TPA: hypothetical protein VMG99_01560 [Thermoplasmata archaeon]|jgi:hypothetical protein|nr:hypothetical protein [Thermoplasmata archaeon]